MAKILGSLSLRLISPTLFRNISTCVCVTHRRQCLPSSSSPTIVEISADSKSKISIPNLTRHVRFLLEKNPQYHHFLFNAEPLISSLLTDTDDSGKFLPITKKFFKLSEETNLKHLGDAKYISVISEIAECCTTMSDDDILLILHAMRNFPRCRNPHDPNYKRLWKCLDDECFRRGEKWSRDKCFRIDDAWHPFALTLYVNFQWALVKNFFRSARKLEKENYIRFMFTVAQTVCLNHHMDTFQMEYNLEKHLDSLNIDEIVIVAAAFIKTRKKIHSVNLVTRMVDFVIKHADTIDSTSISIFAKQIRKTVYFENDDIALKLMRAFLPQVSRLSEDACIQLASCGSLANAVDYEFADAVSLKVEEGLSSCPLLTLGDFCLFAGQFNNIMSNRSKIQEKLAKEWRLRSSSTPYFSLPSILYYLSSSQIYLEDVISRVLTTEAVFKEYGKDFSSIPNSIICLDTNVVIENPNYRGNRLPEKLRKRLLKHRAYYFSAESEGKILTPESRLDEISQTLKEIYNQVGNCESPQLLHCASFLPQFHHAGGLFCTDRKGNPKEIPEFLKQYKIHEVKVIPEEEKFGDTLFHLFNIMTRENVINRTRILTGDTQYAERLLKKLGYIVHRVYTEDWKDKSKEERKDFIRNLISRACTPAAEPQEKMTTFTANQ